MSKSWSDSTKKGTSGLPEGGVFTTLDAKWEEMVYEEKGKDSRRSIRLILDGTNDEEDGGGESEETFKLGAGGKHEEADRDGTYCIHENGTYKGFDRKSVLYHFLSSALEAGCPIEDRSRLDDDGVDMEACDALVWVGLKFRWVAEYETFTIDGVERESRRVIVTEYLGEVDTDGGSTSNNGSNDELKAQAVALAKEHEDYSAYLEAATKIGVEVGSEMSSAAFHEAARG